MPITALDIGLLVIMLTSGLLAMVRGFMREVFSIVAWILAAVAALYAALRLSPAAKVYFNNFSDTLVVVGVAVTAFLLVLIVVSIITVRISDMVLDSRVGALDRTLGFLFGLARGFILVAVAFAFFTWLDQNPPTWVKSAKSRVVLDAASDQLKGLLPDDADSYLSRWLRRAPKGDERELPDQHSELPGAKGTVH